MKVGATRDGLVRGADDGALELLDLPQRDLCSLLASSNDWREHVTEASVLRRLAPEDAVGASITDGGSSVWGIGPELRVQGAVHRSDPAGVSRGLSPLVGHGRPTGRGGQVAGDIV